MTQIFVDDQLAIQEGTSLSSGGPFSVKQKMSKYQVLHVYILWLSTQHVSAIM